MDDFESRYWRLRHVVYQLIDIVAGIVGLGVGWYAYHVTGEWWHWAKFLQGCAAVAGFIIGSVSVKKTCDLDG